MHRRLGGFRISRASFGLAGAKPKLGVRWRPKGVPLGSRSLPANFIACSAWFCPATKLWRGKTKPLPRSAQDANGQNFGWRQNLFINFKVVLKTVFLKFPFL